MDLGALRARSEPVTFRSQPAAEAAAAVSRFFGENADTIVKFRVHPFPESGDGRRKSVREAECVYVDASLSDFFTWNEGAALAADSPFGKFDRAAFWAYADYKDAADVFRADVGGDDACMQGLLDWDRLVPGCGAEGKSSFMDSTTWVGSKGAHSALHFDTYGINCVLQVRGEKTWQLWSPSATNDLFPTRVPYEESSVFSRADTRKVESTVLPPDFVATLSPGEVLFVPRHWWHDVECSSDEACVSVNVWLDASAPLSVENSCSAVPSEATDHRKRGADSQDGEAVSRKRVSGTRDVVELYNEKIADGYSAIGATMGDALSRVSEAITRVVVSALLDRQKPTAPGTAPSADGSEVDTWLNPTEEVYGHGTTMHSNMIRLPGGYCPIECSSVSACCLLVYQT